MFTITSNPFRGAEQKRGSPVTFGGGSHPIFFWGERAPPNGLRYLLVGENQFHYMG